MNASRACVLLLSLAAFVACNTSNVQTDGFATPTPSPTPTPIPTPCTDLDGDGTCAQTDCNDFEPAISPDLLETCNNNRDDNCDDLVDCDDPGCVADPACTGGGVETDCADGVDNDGDGRMDCDDFDCSADPACTGGAEDCTNGIDDDGNGLVDCDDPACGFDPACVETMCVDGVDNDSDGLTDCDDPDCAFSLDCLFRETDCTDGFDNDFDFLTDCDDPDCAADSACIPEDCANGVDDNGDGLTDCADPSCAFDAACAVAEDCGNGVDDDGDGGIDCADSECVLDAACGGSGACTGGSLVVNGDFEAGNAGWLESSTGGFPIVNDLAAGTEARGGSWSAWLGGANDESSVLAVDINIPAGATAVSLSFWWRLETSEFFPGTYDFGMMEILDASYTPLATVANVDDDATTGTWTEVTFDLASYAGQNLRLRWSMTTDSSDITSWYIDDVTVTCN